MEFEYSIHWKEQKETRKEITDDVIEYCIQNSTIIKDKIWENALNAITRIPPSGKLLKVVYRRKGNIIKVITAFWLD